jgi:hypothetical protein
VVPEGISPRYVPKRFRARVLCLVSRVVCANIKFPCDLFSPDVLFVVGTQFKALENAIKSKYAAVEVVSVSSCYALNGILSWNFWHHSGNDWEHSGNNREHSVNNWHHSGNIWHRSRNSCHHSSTKQLRRAATRQKPDCAESTTGYVCVSTDWGSDAYCLWKA